MLYREFCLKIFQFQANSSTLILEPMNKGYRNSKCLNMLLDHGHFYTILSIPWISDHQHYCDDCDVGYSYIEEHRTTCQHRYRCSFCLSEPPPPPPPTPRNATASNVPNVMVFKSMTCCHRHLKPYSPKTSTKVLQLVHKGAIVIA